MNKQDELMKKMTGKELEFHLYLTQFLLLLMSIILSFFMFSSLSDVLQLFHFDLTWMVIGFLSGLFVVFIDLLLMKTLPKRYYDDGGLNEKIFSNMPVWKIALVSLFIALAEEMLFRGVIQTQFGVFIASLIFALIHIRYWKHWYLLANVIILSFFLGYIYIWSGQQLLATISMHFTIDFFLGLYIRRSKS
ncbi:CPBP family intramembrane glutamic endopeptidase [Lederbergia lenta]|uniref:Abortive infection protein n=1 Tax=Lederbergia lenta TaxID=1467 RepID=A0A2X4WC82_LEDLE|nr:CPBP family intramembrane glutamic endopeptidase [Lederbergia lenta]MCM3111589.1 CPBP family intramembrane metalloprotease [Lederbergia lenta]MEC2325023.1 CPBP family intramembrane metalloprotease [Lederbergia lenta]SQI56482.1 abortive infection protein [Lederbergia lenta]